MPRRAVFLDRDGVINEPVLRHGKPYPPANVQQIIISPDAPAALARLKAREFLLLVVTNQPDVRRGTASRESVEEIHRFLAAALPLDDFFCCYHDDADRCRCRKPLPGLLFEAAERYRVELAASYLIGDRWRDIDAGRAAGCKTVLIDRGYDEQRPAHLPDKTALSLTEAVDWIITQEE